MKIKLQKGACAARYSCKNINTTKCKPFPKEGKKIECEYYERNDEIDKR